MMFNTPLFICSAATIIPIVVFSLYEFYKKSHWKWLVCAGINLFVFYNLLFNPQESAMFALVNMAVCLWCTAYYLRVSSNER